MHSPPPQSALTIAAAMMRMVWCGVLSRFGLYRPDVSIEAWVQGIFSKLDDLLAQYRAGTLPPAAAPRVTTAKRAAAGERPAQHVLSLAEVSALLDASPQVGPCARQMPALAVKPGVVARRAARMVFAIAAQAVAVRWDFGGVVGSNFRKMG